MRAGKLRHRIEVQVNANVNTSDFVAADADWSCLYTTWAHVNPLQGRELVNAQQLKDTITHEIRMRYPTCITIDGEKRVKHGSRYLYVQAARQANGERGRELILLCSEEP